MPNRKRQKEFTGEGFNKISDCFGGKLLKGNPKCARPLHSKLPIHLTLRARQSVLRLPKTFGTVQTIIKEVAAKHGVKIYKMANVGNHLHFAIKIPHVKCWAAFIRELTGRLGMALRKVTGKEGLWLFRPHTRVVRGWRKAFSILKQCIELNQFEAEGHIHRRETKTLKDLRAIFDG